jgi:hypothetical protein
MLKHLGLIECECTGPVREIVAKRIEPFLTAQMRRCTSIDDAVRAAMLSAYLQGFADADAAVRRRLTATEQPSSPMPQQPYPPETFT